MTGLPGWRLLARLALAVALTLCASPPVLGDAAGDGGAVEARAVQDEHVGEESGGEPGAQDDHGAQEEHAAQGEHGAEAEHAGEEHHGPTWREYLFKWINFGLLLGLLWWLLVDSPSFVADIFNFEGLRTYLKKRRESILESRRLADERRQEAQRLLQESAARLDDIETSVAALLDEARQDAERERERAENEGRRQAERVKETASRELRAEALAARRELRAFVADLAVDRAEQILRQRLSPDIQDELVRAHLARLGERVA